MRRMIDAAAVALTLHTLAFFFWFSYRQVVIDAGGLFTHANNIADLPRLALIGYIFLGIVAAAIGILPERLDHLLWRGDQK
jgi:TRAP-type C4-dicarboxylate transport system permease small subunit